MAKITTEDSIQEIIIKMSEGNPGALSFIMEALSTDTMNFVLIILPCDILEIYGSKLYMLWNDACDRDISRVQKVLAAWREGKLTKEEIKSNLNKGRATPFVVEGVTL